MKTPKSKIQDPDKHQDPNINAGRGLELGIWIFSGAWSLELGAFSI
jgi:hypothetical protein